MTKIYCLRFETPSTWKARLPYLYPPGSGWPGYTPNALVSFFVAPTTRRAMLEIFDPASTKVKSYITTDGQSASLSWNKAPIWGLRPDLYYCLTVAGFLMWGALSDERTGLSLARVTVSSSKSVVSMYSYNLHFTCC
jgi:hypothetical protein